MYSELLTYLSFHTANRYSKIRMWGTGQFYVFGNLIFGFKISVDQTKEQVHLDYQFDTKLEDRLV